MPRKKNTISAKPIDPKVEAHIEAVRREREETEKARDATAANSDLKIKLPGMSFATSIYLMSDQVEEMIRDQLRKMNYDVIAVETSGAQVTVFAEVRERVSQEV